MPVIKVGDINLEYYVEGDGPPLLMIMGFAGQARTWGRPVVAQLANNFTTIRFSNRGTGLSDRPDAPITIPQMADDTIALLDALGYGHVHVFGISMGGMIAQELVLANPERVNRLVLGCTSAAFAHGTPPKPEDTQGMTPVPGLSREEQAKRFWPVVCAPEFIEKTGVAFLDEILKSNQRPTPLETLMKQGAAVMQHDTFDRLSRIKAPTLIIHGDIDLLVPHANSPVLHEGIAGSEFVTMPGCAHIFFWEKPQEAAALVTEFLTRVPAEA
ncbi:MAG TPA: alpha/beta hydrolase [Dehalococcoidia bacterium]|nr:alpha/beta hydrolase [Dehalococcoidia bacterium]